MRNKEELIEIKKKITSSKKKKISKTKISYRKEKKLKTKMLEKRKELKKGEMVPLFYDEAFKIKYANTEHLETLTILLSSK